MPKDLAPFFHHLGPKVRLRPELLFSVHSRLLIDTGRPHRRRQDDVGQPIIPAEFLEHAQILHRRTTHADVGDPMQIDNPGEQDSVLIGPLQPVCNLPEDIGVALVGIVESGGVDQEKSLVRFGDTFMDPHFARTWGKRECPTVRVDGSLARWAMKLLLPTPVTPMTAMTISSGLQ
ncbi:hypothetical protein VTN96DRAFT_3869 [Rasamsonia emersonii]